MSTENSYGAQNNSERLVELFNLDREFEYQVAKIAEMTGMAIHITPARNSYGNPLPEKIGICVSKTIYTKCPDVAAFLLATVIKVTRENEKELRRRGYPVDDLDANQQCYLGCEKDYWPDREG